YDFPWEILIIHAALLQHFDPRVAVHDPAIGLDPQCLWITRLKGANDVVRRLLAPVLQRKPAGSTFQRLVGVDTAQPRIDAHYPSCTGSSWKVTGRRSTISSDCVTTTSSIKPLFRIRHSSQMTASRNTCPTRES